MSKKVTRKTSNRRPPLLRSNYSVARAVISALRHPKKRYLSDRRLGIRLGLHHRTIGRWRKKLSGGAVIRKVVTKKQFLSACQRVTEILPDAMWRELDQKEMAVVVEAHTALHRVLNGEKTLPNLPSKRKTGGTK